MQATGEKQDIITTSSIEVIGDSKIIPVYTDVCVYVYNILDICCTIHTHTHTSSIEVIVDSEIHPVYMEVCVSVYMILDM